jgi:mannose-1-phosphate guanylyltransferase/mannose-6-phosphate isomerase
MIVVIIAGGSGTRLWPLSTPQYPKHLLRLTGNSSLLQYTFGRASLLSNSIYVVSEASHTDEVYAQLPVLDRSHVIVEPSRRGTASCVIAALAQIKLQHPDNDEPIVFMHADHYIRDTQGFVDTVNRAGEFSAIRHQLVLLGVEPTYAATGFGYIERGRNANGGRPIYEVKSFKEKPDHKTAKRYMSTGRYLWNMGYFVAPLPVFEDSIQKFAPDLWHQYQQLLTAKTKAEHDKRYLEFANHPIDTALIEKVSNLLVTPGTFDWMDVGSYTDIHQVSLQDETGNTVLGDAELEGVTNSLVRNDTDIPVVVIGLDNIVVVSTPNGLVVANKGHSQKVGDVAKRLHARDQSK